MLSETRELPYEHLDGRLDRSDRLGLGLPLQHPLGRNSVRHRALSTYTEVISLGVLLSFNLSTMAKMLSITCREPG